MSRMLKILQTPPEMIKKADVLESIGQWMDENPLVSKILIGGGIGALGGAVLGDGRNTLRNVIGGGLMGAGGGALYHYFTSPGTPAPNAGGNAGAGGGKGQENATTPGTPTPKAEEVSQNPGTGQGEQPVTPPESKEDKILRETQAFNESQKKQVVTPEQYKAFNAALSKMGYGDQVRYIQNLLATNFDIDTTKLNTLWTTQELAKGLAQMASPYEKAIYALRYLQTGGKIQKSNQFYKSGIPMWTGDEATDKFLTEFYHIPESYARNYALRKPGIKSWEELIQAAKWAQKNLKSVIPGD